MTILCLLSNFNSFWTEVFWLSSIKIHVGFFSSLDCLAISLHINIKKNSILDKIKNSALNSHTY